MNLIISKLIGSVFQIILFTLVPLIWWLITARKDCNFFSWIGLKKCGKENKPLLWVCGISAAFSLISILMLYAVRDVDTAASDFSGLGIKALPAILIYAILNTALPEEILFRGFLLKRFIFLNKLVVGFLSLARRCRADLRESFRQKVNSRG